MDELMKQEMKYDVSAPFSNGENFNNLYKMAQRISKSQLVPQNYQGKPEDCMLAIDMANRNGMSPVMVMQNLYVVKGKPVWSGQACMSMIKASKEFKNVRVVYVGEESTDDWGCYVKATYKETGEEAVGTKITIKMAKDEGWYSKPDKYGKETSKWQTMPQQMLAYRAAAFFCRIYLPNEIMGCCVEGEPEDIETVPKKEAENPFDIVEKVSEETEAIFK